MVKLRLAYIFSFFLAYLSCLSNLLFGQVDSTAVGKVDVVSEVAVEVLVDSLEDQKVPFLSSVAVIFDYGKLGAGFLLNTESKYEGGAQFEFYNKFFLIGEYGIAKLEPNEAYINANYISEGSYWRAGVGYKIDMTPKYNFMLGLRYGQSSYADKGQIEIVSESGIFDSYFESFDRRNLSAHWYEIVMSSERRVWNGLYVGFHARLRVMGDYDSQVPLDVFSIPGYGRTIDKSIPALNLYVKYSLEFL